MDTHSAAQALTHSHVYLGRSHDANALRTRWVVALTAVAMVGEIAAGIIYGSMALLADGFHMATHTGALAVAAAAYAYAKRHAEDRRFTFGTGKVGDLAGFGSALVLGVIAIAIAVESGARFFNPTTVAFEQAILVAAIGLGVNIVSALLLSGGHDHGHSHGHHHHGHGHRHEPHHDHGEGGVQEHRERPHSADHQGSRRMGDNNLRSAYFHVLADTLTSVLAIIALLAGRFLDWRWLDPAMGVVGAVVIARWSWTLMRDAGEVLLDVSNKELEAEIRELVETPQTRITDLHTWRVGPESHAAIVSIAGLAAADTVRSQLLALPGLAHVTVEYWPSPRP